MLLGKLVILYIKYSKVFTFTSSLLKKKGSGRSGKKENKGD